MDRWNCGWWCAATVAAACCALAQRGLVGERNVVTQVGGYAVFDCALDFPHDIEIPYVLQWYKDDVKIFSWYDGVSYAADTYAGRVARVAGGMANARGWGRGSINLTAVRETDAGRYTCRVLFPNRTPNTRNNGTCFQLEVDGGNLIARPPVNASTLEGGRAVLECVRKSADTFVRWLKDGTPIADLAELAQRAALGEDGALTVDPAAMSDLGEYECEVSDAMGNLQSARAYLNVQFKAKVIYAPAEVVLPYGRAARLDCHYRANPPLTNLRWEKDGFLFDPLNVRGVYYRRNGSLHFNQTDESHAGMYSCTPYNELGTEGASPVIRVLVRRPPAFLQRPQELYLARLGDTLALPCQATDGAVVTWSRKDGAALAEGRAAVEGGNLTLEGVREEDRGAYVCEARNEAAAVRAVAEVAVENAPPRAPHDLTYRADHTSITLRWQPGYSRPYMDYHVWWRPVDVSEWRTMKILSLRTTEATINHLQPGHEYEIMVLCQDKRGDGMFSKAIRAFTKQYGGESGESSAGGSESFLQLGPPGNVTAHLVAEGFLVTWSPPEYGLEVLRLYVVRWYQGPHEYLLGSAETKNNYMLIPNLSEDEVYTFQVFSMSTADYQTGSEKVSVAVPAYARIRAVGAACGVLAVLLAACALALYAARRRLCGLARRDDARSRKCNNTR